VIPLRLAEVAVAAGGEVVAPTTGTDPAGDPALVTIDEVSIDSRTARPGVLFAALPGSRTDGHDHAPDAVARGATALLVQRHVEAAVPQVLVPDVAQALTALAGEVRRRVAPRTVAITGSVGKTTVKDLTAAAIGAGRVVHAARGSYNNELGVPLTLLGVTGDTEVLIAEVGARHVGDIAALASVVAPDIAIVTAVAGVHLEVFGSIDAIARAKAELVEALPPDGLAILNAADPRVAAMASRAPAVLRVAPDDPTADVTASDIRLDRFARARATVHTPWGSAPLALPIAGRHHVGNALFALAAAGAVGVELSVAAAALADAPLSPWRGEVSERDGVVVLNDAYNASPTAAIAALETLVAVERTGRTIAVLGYMAEIGPTAEEEHERVGRRVAEVGVDALVVVGADAAGYARGARAAGAQDVREVADVPEAIARVRSLVAPGDVVLVKASRVAGLERVAAALVAPGEDRP
jgi:UDP-N-acetylmuramoyl-tripeptide--D-alanyl-D-alanine ligase